MMGRELFIDASQADADLRTGFRTLAVRWNRRAAETWAKFGMLAAVALLILTAGNFRAQARVSSRRWHCRLGFICSRISIPPSAIAAIFSCARGLRNRHVGMRRRYADIGEAICTRRCVGASVPLVRQRHGRFRTSGTLAPTFLLFS